MATHGKHRNYQGKAAAAAEVLQPFALRTLRKNDPENEARLLASEVKAPTAAQSAKIPGFIKPSIVSTVCESGGALWVGSSEGLWRLDDGAAEPLDRVQSYRASAYLLDNNVLRLLPDGGEGVWALTDTGVSHIAMRRMSLSQKAKLISEADWRYMQRRGMLSGASWSEAQKRWIGRCSDNDGLWTGLVAMGDICRYAVLRDEGAPQAEVARARELALRWTEACLLLACVTGWKGKAAAFVRFNKPGTNRASDEYLKEGREGKLKLPEAGPTGMVECDIAPENPDDWALTDAMPQIVFRNIEGYIARSYHVSADPDDGVPFGDGVFFRKVYNPDGRLVSVRLPSTSSKGDDIPPLLTLDASLPVPDRLRKLYTDGGWSDDQIVFKCDTSTDELCAHYALWHLAYDVFAEEDPELGKIISDIAERHARHITDNAYSLVDGGGQPTSWSRMTREYYMNRGSYGVPDAPLSASILLQMYKTAAYITKNPEWDAEYKKLALDEPYRYADLLGEYYDRYVEAVNRQAGRKLEGEELFKALVNEINYSDVRMAFLSFYSLTQLETDPVLYEKYRYAAGEWWKLVKYGRDVEWLLLWQLTNSESEQLDGFGRPCAEVLAWQLSRYNINIRGIFIDNQTRPDAVCEHGLLWYPGAHTPFGLSMAERGGTGTDFFGARSGSRGKSLSHNYNMVAPYWMARYHGLLTDDVPDGTPTIEDVAELINQD